eukprot:scaffold20532_cov123-Isochrysis_galbana.AAC.5
MTVSGQAALSTPRTPCGWFRFIIKVCRHASLAAWRSARSARSRHLLNTRASRRSAGVMSPSAISCMDEREPAPRGAAMANILASPPRPSLGSTGSSKAAAYAGSVRDGALRATASSGKGAASVNGIVAALDVPNFPKADGWRANQSRRRQSEAPRPSRSGSLRTSGITHLTDRTPAHRRTLRTTREGSLRPSSLALPLRNATARRQHVKRVLTLSH